VLILLIFLNVASLGFGRFLPVKSFIIFEVSVPDILTTAIPEMPGPEESAKIVIIFYYSYLLILIIYFFYYHVINLVLLDINLISEEIEIKDFLNISYILILIYF